MSTEYQEQRSSLLYALRGVGLEARDMVYPMTKQKAAIGISLLAIGISMVHLRYNLQEIVENQNVARHNALPVIAQQYDINRDGRLEGREISQLLDARQK